MESSIVCERSTGVSIAVRLRAWMVHTWAVITARQSAPGEWIKIS